MGIKFVGTSSQRITIPSTVPRLSSDYTISCWIIPRDLSKTNYITSDWEYHYRNMALVTRDTGKVALYNGNRGTSEDAKLYSNTVLTVGTLYHIVGTRKTFTNLLEIYIDGILDASKSLSYSGGSTMNNRYVATDTSLLDYNAGVDVFDFRMYTRYMYPSEVSVIFACRGHDNIVNNLVARLPLVGADGETATSIADIGSDKYAFTSSGSPVYTPDSLSLRRRVA